MGNVRLDMEVWSKSVCDMGYGVATYWYGDASTTSNLKEDNKEVLNVPPLPDMAKHYIMNRPIRQNCNLSYIWS